MNTNFHLAFRKENGNLHVIPRGDFDGSSASELVNLLHDQYDGKGRVFIETNQLRRMHAFGCSTFQCRLNKRRIPADRLTFRGTKGYEMAPAGSCVVDSSEIHPGRRCNKDCANCPSSDRRRLENNNNQDINHVKDSSLAK